MNDIRQLINLVEGVVNFADFQKEPKNPQSMLADVKVGPYVIRAAKKNPDSEKRLDYWVYIDGPERNPEDQIDIRRYAGPEPEKMMGLPDTGGKSPEEMVKGFTDFKKRADTLAGYGQDKPPEVRLNPAWGVWRKKAILKMAKNYGLMDNE